MKVKSDIDFFVEEGVVFKGESTVTKVNFYKNFRFTKLKT